MPLVNVSQVEHWVALLLPLAAALRLPQLPKRMTFLALIGFMVAMFGALAVPAPKAAYSILAVAVLLLFVYSTTALCSFLLKDPQRREAAFQTFQVFNQMPSSEEPEDAGAPAESDPSSPDEASAPAAP
jgi:hypothetical protein